MKSDKISLTSAIILNINIMVGSAIFAFPKFMAAASGNASFLSWGIVALLFLPLVMSVVRLSQLFPGAGGFYMYTREGLGKRAGYLSGWLYVAGFTFAIVLEGLALRQVLASRCHDFTIIDNALLFNILFMGSLVLFNMLGMRLLSLFLSVFTICKILPLVILIACIPFIFNPSFTITSTEMSLLPFSLPWAIFGYFGFESCCNITEHIENSEKNGPRAILLGFIITAGIYMLFHFGLLNLMGSQNLAECGAPAYASFLNMNIPYLKEFINWLIPIASIIAIYATAAGLLNANAAIVHAMAQDGLFYKSPMLAQVNRYNRPHIALVLQGVVVFGLLILIPSMDVVTGLCNVGVFLAYLLPFISLFILQRQRNHSYSRLALTIVSILIIIGFIVYNWMLMADTMQARLLYSAVLCLIIGLGSVIKNRQ